MARILAENDRIELRIAAEDKLVLARAAALEHMPLTSFILRAVMPKAQDVIAEAERLSLSERDSLKVLELLENPPKPTDRMQRAIKAGKTLA